MAVRYIGGEPTRITRYESQKNIDRWMHEVKPKFYLPNGWMVGLVVICIAVLTMLVWFVAMCFK